VPPVTVGTAPRHTAGSGLSGKSVREPGTHSLVSTTTVVSPAAVRVRTSTADGMYSPRSTSRLIDHGTCRQVVRGTAAPAGGRPPRSARRRPSRDG
jgi:hypothetical protein